MRVKVHGDALTAILRDPHLSLKSKAVAAQMASGIDPREHIDYWSKERKKIYWKTGRCTDGIDEINRAIQELELSGYCKLFVSWDGPFAAPTYHLYPEPDDREELDENLTDKLHTRLRMDGNRPTPEGE